MTTRRSDPSQRQALDHVEQALDHVEAERHRSAGDVRDQLMKHPSREDRIIAIAAAEKVLSQTAPGAQRDSDRPEPARTSHPTGTGQAAANRDDEPPA